MRVAAVIPARMQSKRLPGKPLLMIGGVPMILRVLDRARACTELSRIIVATDCEEIVRVVVQHGGEARLTSGSHHTGSDRVAEVARDLREDLILNLQGDEPLLPISTIQALIDFARTQRDLTVVTAIVELRGERDIVNPSIVKVVVAGSRALYFSRLPIPYVKDSPLDLTRLESRTVRSGFFKHVGIYLYRREFLLRFVEMPSTPLERAESLEQLRIIENGEAVYVVKVREDSMSVDTPEDLMRVQALVDVEQNTIVH